MKWIDDFPVIGIDEDEDGTGEPVLTYKKPNVGKAYPISNPPESDEFNSEFIGLQWQWQANPKLGWAYPFPSKGVLRMNSVFVGENYQTLWNLPNLLLQKFPSEEFTATAKITLSPRFEGEKFGLVILGQDHSYLGITYKNKLLYIAQATAENVENGGRENESTAEPLTGKTFYLRVKVEKEALCKFSYSTGGSNFTNLGIPFKAREGKWIGAKMGFFFIRPGIFNDAGTADIDWFRVE